MKLIRKNGKRGTRYTVPIPLVAPDFITPSQTNYSQWLMMADGSLVRVEYVVLNCTAEESLRS